MNDRRTVRPGGRDMGWYGSVLWMMVAGGTSDVLERVALAAFIWAVALVACWCLLPALCVLHVAHQSPSEAASPDVLCVEHLVRLTLQCSSLQCSSRLAAVSFPSPSLPSPPLPSPRWPWDKYRAGLAQPPGGPQRSFLVLVLQHLVRLTSWDHQELLQVCQL
jgi:hypothetical protein